MKGREKDNCKTKKLCMDRTSLGTMGSLATERSLHVIDLHFPETTWLNMIISDFGRLKTVEIGINVKF